MKKSPIRTITLGIAEAHPLKSSHQAGGGNPRERQQHYTEAGYEVQTVRLSTCPIFDNLADWSSSDLLNYVQELPAYA